jgi:guanosine-3',5'-bis(diphosphate) 3'-pyrophosphohydrolase
MECYTHWARCTRSTSRSTRASATSSPSPRQTATSRCTPCCSRRSARRSKCRSAPRTWTCGRTRHCGALGLQEHRLLALSAQSRAHAWLTSLLESQQFAGSSLEFLENVKVDLFPDEVYLFSPKGDILALPRNATALDFAYAVHTDVGDHAVAARVDKKLVPLRSKLVSGQTVEIITAASASPNPSWLEFVVSSKARTSIRHYLKHLQHEDAVELGHRMLDRALEALDSSLDRVPAKTLEQYLAENRLRRLEDLLAEVALGNRMPQQVAQALTQAQGGSVSNKPGPMSEKILISGAERGVLSFANCCHPIPGDEIMGFLSSGKGVVVHRLECPNVAEYRKSPERCVPIAWDRSVQGDYRAALRVEVENKPGVLAQVAAAIAEAESNIDNVEYRERDLRLSVMDFNIEVKHRKHLADVMRRLRRLGWCTRVVTSADPLASATSMNRLRNRTRGS